MSSLATKSQYSYLHSLYQKGIGYSNTMWYLNRLKTEGFTMPEAKKEISRLVRLRQRSGASALMPIDWEKIRPSSEELDRFMDDFGSRTKLVVDRGR